MSQIPPPLAVVAITVLGPILVYLALFVPRALRYMPGMGWGFGPDASRFTLVVVGSGMFGVGLNLLDMLPKSVYVIGSFIWFLLIAAAAAHDIGKPLNTWEPPAPRLGRKTISSPRKDRRAAKRRARRRSE